MPFLSLSPDPATSYEIPYEGSPRTTTRLTFEVTSAEVIKEARSGSVLPGHSSHVVSTTSLLSLSVMITLVECVCMRWS